MAVYFYETELNSLFATKHRFPFLGGFLFKAKNRAEAWNKIKPYVNRLDRRNWTLDYVNNLLNAAFQG